MDLRRLFEVVVQRGGYDAVSAEKMAWRRLGVEFGLGQAGTAPGSMAFNLKTAYYKNLAYVVELLINRDVRTDRI